LDKNDKSPKKTILTVDFTGCQVSDLYSPAEDTIVIAWQGRCRRAKVVPAAATILVKSFLESLRQRAGGPVTVEGLLAQIETLTPAEKAEMAKMLQARKAA
jgi:hypothetical protein